MTSVPLGGPTGPTHESALPVPLPDPLTRPYWAAAAQGRLRIMQCSICGQWRHPPSGRCEHCDGVDTKWVELSGEGVVATFIVNHRALIPGFAVPYVIAQVVPIEVGSDPVLITANIIGCDHAEVYVGMRVTAVFVRRGDAVTLPQFRPAH